MNIVQFLSKVLQGKSFCDFVTTLFSLKKFSVTIQSINATGPGIRGYRLKPLIFQLSGILFAGTVGFISKLHFSLTHSQKTSFKTVDLPFYSKYWKISVSRKGFARGANGN